MDNILNLALIRLTSVYYSLFKTASLQLMFIFSFKCLTVDNNSNELTVSVLVLTPVGFFYSTQNWEDWKYTSFEMFIHHSQNIRRHSAMGGRMESLFSNHLFYVRNREYLCRTNIINKIQIDAKH